MFSILFKMCLLAFKWMKHIFIVSHFLIFQKNAKKHLQHRETCAIIHLGCGRLVQNKQAAQAAICVDAGGCRRKAEGLAGFSAEYVRS